MLKSKLAIIIRNSFINKKQWKSKIQIFGIRSRTTLFGKEHSFSNSKCTEDDVSNVLEILLVNIFVHFTEKVFQQVDAVRLG